MTLDVNDTYQRFDSYAWQNPNFYGDKAMYGASSSGIYWFTFGSDNFLRMSFNQSIEFDSIEYSDSAHSPISDYTIDLYNCQGEIFKTKQILSTQSTVRYEIVTFNYDDFE